ncbi:MAG: gamma-glutamyltransferase [Sphingopyxis granuli]|uniref:gamma-glutamyltransferase n=1 Tax=Sphingopyxis granuli TaxID=267128 RepID=UPI003C71847F
MFGDEKGKKRAAASCGYLAPGVPGTVAGVEYAHRKWGKLPLKAGRAGDRARAGRLPVDCR